MCAGRGRKIGEIRQHPIIGTVYRDCARRAQQNLTFEVFAEGPSSMVKSAGGPVSGGRPQGSRRELHGSRCGRAIARGELHGTRRIQGISGDNGIVSHYIRVILRDTRIIVYRIGIRVARSDFTHTAFKLIAGIDIAPSMRRVPSSPGNGR